MGKKRDRWYERQIEAVLQDDEDASKPLSERTVRSKKTEVPFVERKVDKPRERTEGEKVNRERAREWIREMEEEWEKEQDRNKRGKAKKGENEEGLRFGNVTRPNFAMMWEEHRSLELLREAEGENDRLGLSIRDLVESGKIKPPGPLDDMDRELLAQKSGGSDELDKLFVPQMDMEVDDDEEEEDDDNDDVIVVEARKGKGGEKVTESR